MFYTEIREISRHVGSTWIVTYMYLLRVRIYTLMCLSIGTPKIINFPFVPNGKFIIFRCPKI